MIATSYKHSFLINKNDRSLTLGSAHISLQGFHLQSWTLLKEDKQKQQEA